MIEFYRVNKEYNGNPPQQALKDINLHIRLGEIMFLVGESGAGKSTLLKMLYKAETPDAGRILIGRVDITRLTNYAQLRRRMGLIFQDVLLLPYLNIFDNVAYALRAAGASEKEIRYRTEGALNVVGLLERSRDMPHRLSGGERQRIAIARAIVTNPTILLADEPTGNLDGVSAARIFQLFLEINKKLGMTMIIATHDPKVHDLAKRIVRMSNGAVVEDTNPSELSVFSGVS